jgi:hypothetical protein
MFGVVVYEIVSRCEPHADKDPLKISLEIRDKCLTPKIPRECPQKLRQLTEMCWKKQPEQRPVSLSFVTRETSSRSRDVYTK